MQTASKNQLKKMLWVVLRHFFRLICLSIINLFFLSHFMKEKYVKNYSISGQKSKIGITLIFLPFEWNL